MLDPDAMEKALDLICDGRPSYERAVLKVIFKRRYPKKLNAQGLGRLPAPEVERRFAEHLDGLEAVLGRSGYLVGESVTLADIAVGAQLDEMVRTSRVAGVILARGRVKAWLAGLPAGR